MRHVGILAAVAILTLTTPATAYEPIFAPGAHVHSKGSHEVSLGYHRERAGGAGKTKPKTSFPWNTNTASAPI
jgi:hypothetical protein